MIRRIANSFVALFWLALFIQTIAVRAQEKRFAFVATNQNHARELIPLQFSHADGDIVATALRETGFDVQRLKDSSRAAFQRGLTSFVERLKAAGPDAVALFYFSGHVWADTAARQNYVILDENLPAAREAIRRQDDDGFKRALLSNLPRIGVRLQDVTNAIRAIETKAVFVVIDSHLDVAEPALVEPVSGRARDNGVMLVAQGRPGMPAADSNDFSKALAGALLTPGLDAQAMFKQVQLKVIEVTNGKQAPWIEDRLNVDFSFTPKREGVIRIAATDPQHARVEQALWDAVRYSDDPKVVSVYIDKFPNGRFKGDAEDRLSQLLRARITEQARVQTRNAHASLPGFGSLQGVENAPKALQNLSETRVALVIGNANYRHSTKLPNPLNDAKAMAQTLRNLRFSAVHEHYDLDREGFVAALRAFGDIAKGADWAVVYFAGHGMELAGVNILLPVDAKLERIEDAEDEAVPVKRLFDRLGDVKGIKIVILDACRDNPIAARSLKQRGGVSYGLAQPVQVESGTLIALAADPGKPAYDGKGPHSPYAEALLKHIVEPRLDVRRMFGKVNDSLMEAMPGKQEAWIQVKLSGQREYFFQPE